jgi:hypothetical protein
LRNIKERASKRAGTPFALYLAAFNWFAKRFEVPVGKAFC